jgi:capsular polysaccharide biosynthesis protein
MNETSALGEVQQLLVTQAPVLLVSVGGLMIALRLWRKAPAASWWAVAAFMLGILTCALVVIGRLARSDVAVNLIGPLLQGVAWVFLLAAVYAGRPIPSAPPTASPESVWQRVSQVVHARPGLLTVFLVCFTSVFLLVVMSATLITFLLPESFVSKARVVLRPVATSAAEASTLQGASAALDPHFVQTQCEVVGSEAILGKVIGDLDLNREFGKNFANGERLKTSETMMLLRGRIDVRPVRNTSVLDIRLYSEKPEEAAKIANAIAEAYRDYLNPPAAGASSSGAARVEIIDRAVPGFRPIHPNKPLNITLGVVMGLVLGLVVGGGAWWAGLALGTKQPRKTALP